MFVFWLFMDVGEIRRYGKRVSRGKPRSTALTGVFTLQFRPQITFNGPRQIAYIFLSQTTTSQFQLNGLSLPPSIFRGGGDHPPEQKGGRLYFQYSFKNIFL